MGSVLARAGNYHQRPFSLLGVSLEGSLLFAHVLGTSRQILFRRFLLRCFCYILGMQVVVTCLLVLDV